MTTSNNRFRAPLHIHVATLFIVLVIGVGSIMAALQYKNSSGIIKDSSAQIVDLMVRHVEMDFRNRQVTAASTLELMRHNEIINTHEWLAREKYIPWLQQLLRNQSGVTAFIIGYPDGDVLLLKAIRSAELRAHYNAPDSTEFVLEHIDREDNVLLEARRYYLNADRQILKKLRLIENIFDPRVRPWYQLAIRSDEMIYTPPYAFFSNRKIGITMARATANNVVVAADFTLESFSKVLGTFPLPDRSVITIFDKQGQVLGYPDETQMSARYTGHALRAPMLYELDSGLLENLAMPLLSLTGEHEFEYNSETWAGDIRDVTLLTSLPMKLAVLIPEQSLLAEALRLRDQNLLLTLLILMLSIPAAWLLSRMVSNPLRILSRDSAAIRDFRFDQVKTVRSMVLEIDDLSVGISIMNETISHFLQLINSLAEEKHLDSLLNKVANETRATSGADAALLLLLSEDKKHLEPRSVSVANNSKRLELDEIPTLPNNEPVIGDALASKDISQMTWDYASPLCQTFQRVYPGANGDHCKIFLVPLINRDGKKVGLLALLFELNDISSNDENEIQSRLPFIRTLSGFAAVSVETRTLIRHQKKLFAAFIELIAGAIDAKSPYTGGHCQRVPELTKMLAKAACESNDPPYDQYDLNEEQWEALHVAGWLHDCGKITTPEQVVDKATKLETRYDRIHEIRMRFEVKKLEAQLNYWQSVAKGDINLSDSLAESELNNELKNLDKDFAFVAQCNQGGEFLAEEDKIRLTKIGQITWTRTISDRLGISWEEMKRKESQTETPLPVVEQMLADKDDHKIAHSMAINNARQSFNLRPLDHKYNLGELHNLTISRGTLSDEERFLINDHIVQTIMMLECLPYPDHLKNVPAIAGGHHEKMDGTGYPRGLKANDMPATARMMAIADIFEALTAADRPYKKAKPLSECMAIMLAMAKTQHIDRDLFRLFVKAGVYKQYGERYLKANQIDDINEEQLISALDTMAV